jgi:hypothetical protein
MRSFFYFVPGRQILTLADAAKIGLAYAFETGIDCTQVPTNGPGGQAGIVCAQQDSYVLGKNGYHASQQVWRQMPGSDVWVGHYRDELPGPEDLARAKQLSGKLLDLADNRQWQIPMARSYSERAAGDDVELFWTVQLPMRLDIAADGRWVTNGVNPRYAALWELAESWLRIRIGTPTDDDRKRLDFAGQNDAAVLSLQTNYRVGRIEAALLGLLTDELVVSILDQLVDLQTLSDFTKKKAMTVPSTPSAGSASCGGLADAIPTTVPLVPTSPP